MGATYPAWDPASPTAWARALGLVHVPLFGPGVRRPGWSDECAVLLDGRNSSFAVCSVDEAGGREAQDFLRDDRPITWSWSSQLRHVLILNPSLHEMYLRRWDAPEEFSRFRMPDSGRLAEKLLPKLAQVPEAAGVDAVLHSLRGFRRIRMSLPSRDALDAIRVFNAFLLGVEAVREKRLHGWAACTRVDEALGALRQAGVNIDQALGSADLRDDSLHAEIGDLLEWFVSPEPTTGLALEPDLLLRHAAGELYQEAHILIERDQMALPGLAGDLRPKGSIRSDVHFTPVPLARFLVQEAFAERGKSGSELTILDPACGSGVFLLEALRELQTSGWTGNVTLRGFDTSPVSCAMARFCLARAGGEAGKADIRVTAAVDQADALGVEWGRPDLVLMNPPFVSWEAMDREDRHAVTQVLGTVGRKRVDKAMAFIWRAARCLGPRGALASLLPAPLFETQTGVEWREGLAAEGQLRFLGRLRGYTHFQDALVEPGMLVLTRPGPPVPGAPPPVRVLLAEEGREDEAIRGARRHRQGGGPSRGDGWEMTEAPGSLAAQSWMPRSRRQLALTETLARAGVPRVGDLFHVRQGIRTGWNRAFVLAEDELRKLPRRERRFFRPVASNATIRQGVIHRTEFVFYPYDERGLTLGTEDQVREEVPTFYSVWLRAQYDRLVARFRARQDQWWVLSLERHWQRGKQPKLVSKYFGGAGGFAYDDGGDFVVLQGYAWLWRGDGRGVLRDAAAFYKSPLPFAYLALLNSPVFDALLAPFCPRVQGGQYDLSTRFVGRVFLPNLANSARTLSESVADLAELGRRIHGGVVPDPSVLAEAAAAAYAIPRADASDLVASAPVRGN